MPSEVKSQLYRMTFILSLLALLGGWQYQFVLEAINANIFLNATIFMTFFFGAFIAYRIVFALRNEFVALNALKEEYEDVEHAKAQEEADPYWRFYRCKDDMVLFNRPKTLERPYHIISEEIGRTKKLSMSTGVMQTLLDSIDDRLDEGKSLVNYVTGLLVFLGLIGTFVGLMQTLGSVGDIIGNIDLTGGAGTDAIQGLMNDLKIPLQGMATGFSSSLFGLVTSLALGMMARFVNSATGVLKQDFEIWLAGVSKMDAATVETEGGNSPNAPSEDMSMMLRVARFVLVSNTKLTSSVERMAQSSELASETQVMSHDTIVNVASSLKGVTQSQAVMQAAMLEVVKRLENGDDLRGLISNLETQARLQTQAQEKAIETASTVLDQQKRLQQQVEQDQQNALNADDIKWLLDDVQNKIKDDFTKLDLSQVEIKELFEQLSSSLHENNRELAVNQLQIASHADALRGELTDQIKQTRWEIRERNEKLAEESKVTVKSVQSMQAKIEESFRDKVIIGASNSTTNTFSVDQENIKNQEVKQRRRFPLFRKKAS